MPDRPCPLELCDGSGFVGLEDGDEDNCAHVGVPDDLWTPEVLQMFFVHYETPHACRIKTCAWRRYEEEVVVPETDRRRAEWTRANPPAPEVPYGRIVHVEKMPKTAAEIDEFIRRQRESGD